MPKSIFIDPKQVRKKTTLELSGIPVNHYDRTVDQEKERFSSQDFMRIFRDMTIIREFETMLNSIKTTNTYEGISYNHPGPAHLSIGQEASAVGMAYVLGSEDFIFGSHRSHGEILAKGLSAIHKSPEKDLLAVMEQYGNGLQLAIVDGKKPAAGNVRDLAVDFLLYGTLAEIFAKETGFQKGLGGSMHAFFPPFGIYPNNAIVGGSADIAVGAALYKKINGKNGIVVANIGDASIGCGPVWEAICLSTMDQFVTLWNGAFRGGLRLIFNFINNQYGMGGQTAGETMGFSILARIGAGVNPEQMHAERIDGYNPLAVIDAFLRKKYILEENNGPVLLDTVTYRFTGHSPSDAGSYRTKEEVEAWKKVDSLLTYKKYLVDGRIAGEDECAAVWHGTRELVKRICRLAVDPDVSPRMDLSRDPDAIGKLMFSNRRIEKMEERPCEVLLPREENPAVLGLKKKIRFSFEDGKPVPRNRLYHLRDGILEAILEKFYVDPTLVAFGEENRDWGGAFAVYRGLTETLPYHRLFNTSISEGAIVGAATGYALCGGRVVAELMYADFMGRAGDELFNQLSKWQAMSAGELSMPAIIRVSIGSKYGAQHSQDWTSLPAHIPGLKVVYPATPYDAKGIMNAALAGTDPVIFFESQRIYDVGEMFHEGGVPEGYYEVPIGEPDIKKQGNDITILTVGPTLYTALAAARILDERWGISAELVDARSLVPFRYDTVLRSVQKTGKIICAGDACERGSHLKDIAQTISELAFDFLDAPVVVVGSRNWITPAYELEKYFFPQPEWIIDAIHQKMMPLPGHRVSNNYTGNEKLRLNKLGV